jgi:hypothetical protein
MNCHRSCCIGRRLMGGPISERDLIIETSRSHERSGRIQFEKHGRGTPMKVPDETAMGIKWVWGLQKQRTRGEFKFSPLRSNSTVARSSSDARLKPKSNFFINFQRHATVARSSSDGRLKPKSDFFSQIFKQIGRFSAPLPPGIASNPANHAWQIWAGGRAREARAQHLLHRLGTPPFCATVSGAMGCPCITRVLPK